MSNQALSRICIVASLAVGGAVFPWWLSIGLVLFCEFLIPSFYEGAAVAFYMDILYGAPPALHVLPFPMTLCALAGVLIAPFVRRRIILYRRSA